MTEEKKTSIFGKMKKAITGENCSCCCNIKIVPEKPGCDDEAGSKDQCGENCSCRKSE
ncbi:MAG: hypothetical protein Q7J08_01910 [Methanocorpusculum sp.]|jgi:hypothetical protein|uniref:hypothetical protein n=1 Tax=Methanocorpusculum sp. TaxID=2058474 RepID=UPI002716FA70|nr:hypothetical protein [Methanocorpusculum sp.]MDO9522448.1 hypothetical protein [Methanocorpusculum sp.]